MDLYHINRIVNNIAFQVFRYQQNANSPFCLQVNKPQKKKWQNLSDVHEKMVIHKINYQNNQNYKYGNNTNKQRTRNSIHDQAEKTRIPHVATDMNYYTNYKSNILVKRNMEYRRIFWLRNLHDWFGLSSMELFHTHIKSWNCHA